MTVATTGAQVIYNHNSIEKQIKDHYLTLKAYHMLNEDKQFKNTHIVISTYHADMLLTGQAPTQWQIIKAEKMIRKIKGIKKIYNVIECHSPSSMLIRVSDTWITTKIKSKIIASNEIDAAQVQVVTENGVVYLMGQLTVNHAHELIEIASETAGVLRVINMISYITISRNINAPQYYRKPHSNKHD